LAAAGGAAALDDDDARELDVTALTTLLDGLVDYAGLFPPAALSMREAVRNYAAYRAGVSRGMLARFVVPVARLDEFVSEASVLAVESEPWPLAVLAGAADAATLDAFDAAHGARWRVDTIEAKADSLEGIAALVAAFGARRTVYVELPVGGDLEALIAAVGGAGMRAKIRTGGVTADAFPSPMQVMAFLSSCISLGVPFKATAGLHHPLRGEYALTYAADAPRGTMYGFLNVFLAAVLLHAGYAPGVVMPVLEERDASALRVSEDAIEWRGLRASAAQIAATRARFAGSFGSCSFTEPVQDLAALSLLPTSR
jgi:hypothetical protein